jgi:alpha-L-rhamnosidase
MTSFNHYALGAVADWMHRVIGGIAPLEPGYAKVLVAPRPGGDLTWARSSLETRHGRVSVEWRLGGELTLDLEIPDQVTALVRWPDRTEQAVGAGQHRLSSDLRVTAG